MAFFNKYPYTDMENLNLDWVIKTINQVDTDLSGIREDCERIAREAAQDVADQLIIQVDEKIRQLDAIVDGLERDFKDFKDEINSEFAGYVAVIDHAIADLKNQINSFVALIDSKIAINNAYIFDEITNHLVPNLKVRDFFTGLDISIQDMFNKLASLHVTDGLSYSELTGKNISYAALTALNFSYEDLLIHGNSLIP